ncbi:MAG: type II secretion system protein [Phycisphaerae bacterium]|nr:type II secretion system protein [Phycisphaerae bacterium]
MTRPERTTPHAAMSRGFTMIELLVSISIIVVLLALVTGVGFVVIQKQKIAVTKGLVSALDRALDEYIQLNGALPPFNREDYVGVPGPDVVLTDTHYFRVYPTSGGPGAQLYPLRPDSAVFLRQAMGYGQVQSIVSGIGASFLRITTTPAGSTDVSTLTNQWNRDTDVTPSAIDSWADLSWMSPWRMIEDPSNPSIAGSPKSLQQLIFYVHPDNKLAQALFGKCESSRPYFMSAGPDGFYGIPYEEPQIIAHHGLAIGTETPTEFRQRVMKKAREDNVYSSPVKWDFDVDPSLLP